MICFIMKTLVVFFFGVYVKSYSLHVLAFYLRLYSLLDLEYDRLLKTTLNSILDYPYMTFNVNQSAKC